VEPTVAVLLGVLGFNEAVAHDVVSLATQALGGFLAVAGVFVLGRSALLVGAYGGPGSTGEIKAADRAEEGAGPSAASTPAPAHRDG
jgi:hypothetical protein